MDENRTEEEVCYLHKVMIFKESDEMMVLSQVVYMRKE